MLSIISKATIRFNEAAPKDAGEDFQPRTHIVRPNTLPVEAPDWLRDNDDFKAAVASQHILLLTGGEANTSLTAPTPQQLALVSDEDLAAELKRRADVKKDAAKDSAANKGSVGKDDKTGDAGANGADAAKAADLTKQAQENKNGGPGAPAPKGGSQQSTVDAAQSGDGKTSRA